MECFKHEKSYCIYGSQLKIHTFRVIASDRKRTFVNVLFSIHNPQFSINSQTVKMVTHNSSFTIDNSHITTHNSKFLNLKIGERKGAAADCVRRQE